MKVAVIRRRFLDQDSIWRSNFAKCVENFRSSQKPTLGFLCQSRRVVRHVMLHLSLGPCGVVLAQQICEGGERQGRVSQQTVTNGGPCGLCWIVGNVQESRAIR